MTVRVKICGVTRAEDAIAAVAAGADLIGINFYAPSPRSIDLDRALEIRAAIGRRAILVGVFVNAARTFIEQRRRALELDMLQFHGDEDDDALARWPVPVIRAIRARAGDAACGARAGPRGLRAARHFSSRALRRNRSRAAARGAARNRSVAGDYLGRTQPRKRARRRRA